MSTHTPNASSAREAARQANGEFGTQLLAEGGDLDLIAAAEDREVLLGDGMEPISLAEARRMMPVGSTVQAFFPGRLDGEVRLRTVTQMAAHKATFEMEDGQKSHLGWETGTTAHVDESGAIVLKDAEGTPFVVYIPLDSQADALAGDTPLNPDMQLRHREARESTDPDLLDDIASSPVPRNRAYAAENAHTSTGTLARLSRDDSVIVRRAVAANPNTPTVSLDRLAADSDEAKATNETKVAYWVAANPSTEMETLDFLAENSTDEAIRNAVARHANTSPETLRLLATTPIAGRQYVDGDLRSNVASNPNTPSDILAGWERSDGWTMPQVAKNPSTPADVLERMSADTSTGNQTRAMVASNPSAPAHVIDRLSREGDKWVREHAAKNPALTKEAASRLAVDPDERVRRSIAASSTDPEVLKILTRDSSKFVQSTMVRNPAHQFCGDPECSRHGIAAGNQAKSDFLSNGWSKPRTEA